MPISVQNVTTRQVLQHGVVAHVGPLPRHGPLLVAVVRRSADACDPVADHPQGYGSDAARTSRTRSPSSSSPTHSPTRSGALSSTSWPAHRHAAGRGLMDGRQHVARADGQLRWLCARSPCSALGGRDVPRRTAHGGRVAPARPSRPWHRPSFSGGTIGADRHAVLDRCRSAMSYGWRTPSSSPVRWGSAGCCSGRRLPGLRSCRRPNTSREDVVAESARAEGLGAGLQLRAAGDRPRADPDRHSALSDRRPRHSRRPKLNGIVWVPPLAWGIGYFFWGWAADRFRRENRRPVGMFLLLTASVARPRGDDDDHARCRSRSPDVMGQLHRRWLPDGCAEGRLVRLPARAGRA